MPASQNLLPTFLTLAIAAVAGAPLTAQVFVVDSQNGPGTQFTDLPPAIAAVPSGATLHVRPGTYSSFSIANKSLTVIGHRSAAGAWPTVNLNALLPGIFLGPLAGNQSVTISGFDVAGLTSSAQFNVTGCAGPVVLEDMTWTFQVPLAMTIAGSANVHAARLTLSAFIPGNTTPSNPPLTVQNSSAEFWRLVVQGYRSGISGGTATAAMRISQQSRVVLVDPNIGGGAALVGNSVAGAGVVVNSSTLHAYGNAAAGATIALNGGVASSGAGGTGLVLQQGAFARVRGFAPSGGFGFPSGQPFTVDATSTIDHAPAVVAPSAHLDGTLQPGNTIRFTLFAQPGSFSALLFGFSARFAMDPILHLGAFGVDSVVSLAPGIVPASGRIEVPVVVAANWQPDTVFLAQFLVLDPAAAQIGASNVFPGTSR